MAEFGEGELLSLISSLNTMLGQIRDAIKAADATVAALAGAPVDAAYVVAGALNSTLTGERLLAGTANEITVTDGGAGGSVTLSHGTNFVHSGTGPHVLGGAAHDSYQFRLTGALTATADDTAASQFRVDGDLTGVTGNTQRLEHAIVRGTITTQASENVGTVATLTLVEPDITVSSGASVTNSATLYITGSATEATNNYTIWSDAGFNRFDAAVCISDTDFTQATLNVRQDGSTAAKPPLRLEQVDTDQDMMELEATIGTGNAIEAVAAKSLTTTHFIKVTITGGLVRYFPVGTIA